VGALAASVVLLALAQQPALPASTAEFLELEDVWNRAHLQGDAAALARLWTDDIVVIVPGMPPFTKTQALSVMRTGRMRFERYETSDVTVRSYAGCVVVTGRLRRSRRMGSRVVDDDWRFTKVYVHGPSGWRVATFHASEAGE
jgi:ketosteroid isomerase-like protein